jgi:transcription elongation factor Elf1
MSGRNSMAFRLDNSEGSKSAGTTTHSQTRSKQYQLATSSGCFICGGMHPVKQPVKHAASNTEHKGAACIAHLQIRVPATFLPACCHRQQQWMVIKKHNAPAAAVVVRT